MRRPLTTSIFSCVVSSTTLETKLVSLKESFWSSNSLSSSALCRSLVGLVVEVLAFDRQSTDVVHDLAAEIVFARLGYPDLLLDGTHEPLVRLFVLPGVLVADLLLLCVGLDVVDVIGAELGNGVLIGNDGPLHLVLDDVLVLLLHHRQKLPVTFLLLLGVNETVVLEPGLELVHAP